MVVFLANVICFGVLISIITLGISVASQKGAILYYLKQRFISAYYSIPRRIKINGKKTWTRKSKEHYVGLIKEYSSRKIRCKGFRRTTYEDAIKLCNYNLWKIRFFIKPIILCIKCMPSFWGLFLFIAIPNDLTSMHLLLSVCLASIINSKLGNYVLDN